MSCKILVVDDEPEIGWLFNNILREDGYQVLIASTGEEALCSIEREKPDLIFLDVKLPDMDGISILQKIIGPGSKGLVAMITAHEDARTAVMAMKLGAYDYIIKPPPIERIKAIAKHAQEVASLNREVHSLRQQIAGRWSLDRVIGTSHQMQRVFDLVRKVAPHDVTVLLCGESGSGKEVIARAIHEESPRRDRPFVSIDCATLPETLAESELFGYERGAFTGALHQKPGMFELAQGGTLFLDEVANAPSYIQAKLLRVLQEKEVRRLGGKNGIAVDVRLIAATNMDLNRLIEQGDFRLDLYYRLNTFVIPIPPLREREGDLMILCKYFLDKFNIELNKSVNIISYGAMGIICNYPWPGNVRELMNSIKRAAILAEEKILPQHLPATLTSTPEEWRHVPISFQASKQDNDLVGQIPPSTTSLKDASRQAARQTERQLIITSLLNCGWNKAKAARLLGIDYKTLYNKIKAYKIGREGTLNP